MKNKPKTAREMLEIIYFCGGDKYRKIKDINKALSQLKELVPSVDEIEKELTNIPEDYWNIYHRKKNIAKSIHNLIIERLFGGEK